MYDSKANEVDKPWRCQRRNCLIQAVGFGVSWHAVLAGQESSNTFGARIQALDGPATGPASADNLMTNEDSIASVVDQIAKEVPPRQVYLGVGPDQNYTLMAHARPENCYVIDFRKKNQLLHLFHKALVEISTSRIQYLENFWAREISEEIRKKGQTMDFIESFKNQSVDPQKLDLIKQQVKSVCSGWNLLNKSELDEISTLQSRLAGQGPDARFLALKMYPTIGSLITMKSRAGQPAHWLAQENYYSVLRTMQLENRILPINGDWSDEKGFARIVKRIEQDRQKVGLIYLSDVEFFLIRQGLFGKYVKNLMKLPLHADARIIRTSTKEIGHPERAIGLSSTTIVRPLRKFLEQASHGMIKRWEDLFEIT
ncbi:MAG: hypothetical protein DWI24_03455 [Planctomycetota bacterium]|nr:MAG: hypothetical protein DWI24_03455 [Planctomycetota bacterium]